MKVPMSAYLRGGKWVVQFTLGEGLPRVSVTTDVPERSTKDRGKEEARQAGLLIREKMLAELAEKTARAAGVPTYAELTEQMYTPGSAYLLRQEQAGRGKNGKWQKDLWSMLKRYILPKWGCVRLNMFKPSEVENWLLTLPLSDHTKAAMFYPFFRAPFVEYRRDHPDFVNPLQDAEPPAIRDARERDIYTPAELERLFPPSMEELLKVWGDTGKWAFGFLLIRHTGIREGEARALKWQHIFIDDEGKTWVVIQQAVKSDGRIGSLKKREKKKRSGPVADFRLYPLPPRVVEVLDVWRKVTPYHDPDDWVFHGQDTKKPVSKNTFSDALERAMKRAGVKVGDRMLDVHSFRHLFTTEAFDHLPPQTLMQLNGHLSLEMLEHYKHSTLERLLAAMKKEGIRSLLQTAQGVKTCV